MTEGRMVSRSLETNWIIAGGSLQELVTVESSDQPVEESEAENGARKLPVVLTPQGQDSGHCEIKVLFERKYHVAQIYVRSTARVYEVYYAKYPDGVNEYLCTVRCGVADRSEGLIQETDAGNMGGGEAGELLSSGSTEETVTDSDNSTSEEDWVKIKALEPEVLRSSFGHMIGTARTNNVQDLYEATAEICDSYPCSSLTIRLLSLQDKRHLHVDEIYIFVTPIDLADVRNEQLLAGSSTQDSLMAMIVPAILQLSRSDNRKNQDTNISDEALKDGNMEAVSKRIDEIHVELGKDIVQVQYMEPHKLDQDKGTSPQPELPAIESKCIEPMKTIDLPPLHVEPQELDKDKDKPPKPEQPTIERALEQLIARVNTVEGICLRFEDKLLKPIESIEARLQRLEEQLEKISSKNDPSSALPKCTRISAPAFSCGVSASSSFHPRQSDYPRQGTSEVEKEDSLSNEVPQLSCDENFLPSLVISAPEFSDGEDEEDDVDDLQPRNDSPLIKSKKVLSVNDALAAALNGFIHSCRTQPFEMTQVDSCVSSGEHQENQYPEHGTSCQTINQQVPAAPCARFLAMKAPEFTSEEIGGDENHVHDKNAGDTASDCQNLKENVDLMVPLGSQSHNAQHAMFRLVDTPDFTSEEVGTDENGGHIETDIYTPDTQDFKENVDLTAPLDTKSKILFVSAESCDFRKKDRIDNFELASICNVSTASVVSSTESLENGYSVKRSDMNVIDGYFEEDAPGKTANDSSQDLAQDPENIRTPQVLEETNPEKVTCSNRNDEAAAARQTPGEYVTAGAHFNEDVLKFSGSFHTSALDFEFPILDLTFTSDMHASTKYPLEALLCGVAESNTESPAIGGNGNADGCNYQANTLILESENDDLLPIKDSFANLGLSSADGPSRLNVGFVELNAQMSQHMNVSLI